MTFSSGRSLSAEISVEKNGRSVAWDFGSAVLHDTQSSRGRAGIRAWTVDGTTANDCE